MVDETPRKSHRRELTTVLALLVLWLVAGAIARPLTLDKYRDEYHASAVALELLDGDDARGIKQFAAAYEALEDCSPLTALYWVAAAHWRHRELAP